MDLLFIKLVLCLVGSFISIKALNSNFPEKLGYKTLFILGFSWRYILLLIWFIFLDGHVTGDMQGYDFHTNLVKDGLVPNRDFQTPYGFYLNYLNSAVYSIWNNPIMLLITYQIIELAGVYFLSSVLSENFGALLSKKFVILYCFNPLVVSWFAFDGQEELITIFFTALLIWAFLKKQDLIIGSISAIMVFLIKITTLNLSIPFLLTNVKRNIPLFLLSSMVLIFPAVYLGSSVLGFEFTRETGVDNLETIIFPGNIWFLISNIFKYEVNTLLAKVFLVMFYLFTIYKFFSKNFCEKNLNRVLAFVTMLTLSFQLTSTYTSPGFLVVVIPHIVLFVLLNNSINKEILERLFVYWSFVVALDLAVYFRVHLHSAYSPFFEVDSSFPIWGLFIAWQVLILFLNLTLYILLYREYSKDK